MSGKTAIATMLSVATVAVMCLVTIPEASAADLTVKVDAVEGNDGHILVGVCRREEFPRRCALRQRVQARQGSLSVVFPALVPGRYAVTAIHDENDNGKLDTDPSGIPIEGYGFSNGARGHFGPPNFEQSAFDFADADRSVNIELRY